MCGHQAVWHKLPGSNEGHLDWLVKGSNQLVCSQSAAGQTSLPASKSIAPHVSCDDALQLSVGHDAVPKGSASSSSSSSETTYQDYLVLGSGSSQAKLVHHACGGIESGCPYEPSLVSHAFEAASSLQCVHPSQSTRDLFARSRCSSCSSPFAFSSEFEMPDCWELRGELTFLDEKDLQEALLLME